MSYVPKTDRRRFTESQADTIAKEAGWSPLEPFVKVVASRLCACAICGAEHQFSLQALRKKPRCKACANAEHQEVLTAHPKRQCKISTLPEIDQEFCAAGYEPLEPYPGAGKGRLSRCLKCGEVRTPSLQSIRRGSGCKVCDARSRGLKYADADARAQMEALGVVPDPAIPYPGITTPWPFTGICGHRIDHVSLNVLKSGTWSCSECQGEHRLHRVDILEAHCREYGWTVLETEGQRWLMQHDCGWQTRQSPHNPGRYGSGCGACAESGFDPTQPSYLYLVKTDDLLKVGITGKLSVRMSQYRGQFDTVEMVASVGPMDGTKIRDLENDVIAAWRANGIEIVTGREFVNDGPLARTIALEVFEPHFLPLINFVPSESAVHLCGREEARSFLAANHYTGSLPSACQVFGLFVQETLMGVIVYGGTTYAQVARSLWGGSASDTRELRRLALAPNLIGQSASWLISHSMRLIPEEIEMVVSFADPSQGHTGAVYKASNFLECGLTASSYHYVDAGGSYLHKRTVWKDARASRLPEREEASRRQLIRVEDPPKLRFAFPRTSRARKELLRRYPQ